MGLPVIKFKSLSKGLNHTRPSYTDRAGMIELVYGRIKVDKGFEKNKSKNHPRHPYFYGGSYLILVILS